MAELWRRERIGLAPLVGGSDLSFRLLARQYGARITFTEMCIATYYLNRHRVKVKPYTFEFDDDDRPLILQLADNEADPIIEMANLDMFKGHIDAVDINCGCPQRFAMEKGYGAGLFPKFGADHLVSLCEKVARAIPYPLTVKMRLFESVADTVALARRLAHVGVQCVTLHGRYAAQKGVNRGEADWDAVRAVRAGTADLGLCVVGNGDVRTPAQLQRALSSGCCDGVMIGYGALRDPRVFCLPSQTISVPKSASSDAVALRLGSHEWVAPGDAELRAVVIEYLRIARVHINAHVGVLRHLNWLIKHQCTKDDKRALFAARSWQHLCEVLASLSSPILIAVEDFVGDPTLVERVRWPHSSLPVIPGGAGAGQLSKKQRRKLMRDSHAQQQLERQQEQAGQQRNSMTDNSSIENSAALKRRRLNEEPK